MPRLLTGILCLLLGGWSFGAVALESNQVTSARATASLVSDTDTVAPGTAVPHRTAVAAGTRLAHLLAEPGRCRRAARIGPDAA